MGNRWRQWAFAVEGLRSTDKFVLVALADLCHDVDDKARPNDLCWPKIATLMRMTGLHARTIQRALERLEGEGYVLGFEQNRRNGSQSSNLYRMVKHPSGRQLSLADTLADPDTFLPKPVDKSVDKSSGAGGGAAESPICPGAAPPHIGHSATPMTDPTTTLEQEGGADVRPLVSFDDFIGGYDPRGATEPERARKVWNKTRDPRRHTRAVRALPGYNAMLRDNPWREPMSAHNFLIKSAFDDWQPGPDTPESTAAATPALVAVAVGSAQWDAWVAHDAQENADKPVKRSWWVAHCENHDSKVWHFPSAWPPEEGRSEA